MIRTPVIHKNVPAIIVEVTFSFKKNADAKITVMNERVIATGYAILRSRCDKT
jgi:hypothetical protein